jgi:hypothetical protein
MNNADRIDERAFQTHLAVTELEKRRYEIRKDPEPGSPCWDVWKDGAKHRGFTSLAAAKAYLDHVEASR